MAADLIAMLESLRRAGPRRTAPPAGGSGGSEAYHWGSSHGPLITPGSPQEAALLKPLTEAAQTLAAEEEGRRVVQERLTKACRKGDLRACEALKRLQMEWSRGKRFRTGRGGGRVGARSYGPGDVGGMMGQG
jgi:hypothetical protein